MKIKLLYRNGLPRGAVTLSKFTMLLVAVLLGFGTTTYSQVCLTGKHLPRTNPNLLSDEDAQFTVNESNNWKHHTGGAYDVGNPLWFDSSDNQGGCISLSGPNPTDPCCNISKAIKQDMIIWEGFELNTGGTQTISLKCKTDVVCPSPVVTIYLRGFDSNGVFIGDRSNRLSTSKAGVWQEFSFPFRLPPGTETMDISIFISSNEDENNDANMIAYIDDIYIGKDISFEEPPSCKVPFDGEGVKVDELGNFYVKNDDGQWEWFFPFIMHGDNGREKQIYANQGFNAIIVGSGNPATLNGENPSYGHADEAIAAGLRLVPHLGFYYAKANDDGTYGQYDLEQLTPYYEEDGNGIPDEEYILRHLDACLNYINAAGQDNVLAYFVDNEVHDRWGPMTAAIDRVKSWEASITSRLQLEGDRIAPIYMLNGNPGLAPKYLSQNENQDENCHYGDVTSTYISGDGYGKYPNNRDLINLDHQHNQNMPASIAQINGTQSFRARIFGSIAAGARGMDYWRDFLPGHSDYIPHCEDESGSPIANCPNQGDHPYLYGDEGNYLDKFLDINGNLLPTNDITRTEWWDDFPSLVCKIYELQDVIEQPHWTEGWGVSSCVSSSQTCEDADFIIGTRQLGNDRYIIVANYGLDPVTADITFSGLPFTNGELTNVSFIEGLSNPAAELTVELTNSRSQITLPYDGFGVYIIEGQDYEESATSCLYDIYVSGNLSGLYKAAQTITTNSDTDVLPGVNAHLKGEQIVNFKPGFKAHYGSEFRASIEPCDQQCETSCNTLSSFTRSIGTCSVSSTGAKTSIEDKSAIWVRHYPNPFRDEVSLEFSLDTNAEARITISDVNGRVISQLPVTQINRGTQTLNISTRNWVSGIYFYQIQIREQNTGILSHTNGTLVKM